MPALEYPIFKIIMAKKKKNYKIFVLDTNVILHDFQSIYSFQDNLVVIPITLLEEVDKFKRGNEIINFNAREFIRELDKLFSEGINAEGVDLPDGGSLVISTDTIMDESLRKIFLEDKPDHRILSVANNLMKKEKEHTVILVSKDINLRMKAKSIGLNAQDYETGKVKDLDELYRGKNLIEHVPSEIIDRIYKDGQIPVEESGLVIDCYPNEYFILRNGVKSILTTYHKESNSLRLVEKMRAYGIVPRNAEQAFALNALMNPAISLVTLAGKAGTGKTLMALAAALEVRKDYKQILLARPIIPLSNRDLGFLPGDIKTKLDPYMQPLIDNLTVIKHQFKEESPEFARINEMIKNEKLLITPLAYIRGRSLSKVYFIVDEAQNLTPHEVKTIITRAGEGTKVVFTGDPYQIDTPYLDSRSNGLTTLIDKMKGQELYAHITMEKGERSILAELASNIL